jgi:hypothetical protein
MRHVKPLHQLLLRESNDGLLYFFLCKDFQRVVELFLKNNTMEMEPLYYT